MLDVAEIQPGLVLHMRPTVLSARGATCTVPRSYWVQGNHFFVCLSVSGATSRWMPCFSDNDLGDRSEIATAARSGHPKWTDGSCYFHPAQVWEADHAAVRAAKKAGGDMSKPGSRNRVDLGAVVGLP